MYIILGRGGSDTRSRQISLTYFGATRPLGVRITGLCVLVRERERYGTEKKISMHNITRYYVMWFFGAIRTFRKLKSPFENYRNTINNQRSLLKYLNVFTLKLATGAILENNS